MAVRGGGGQSQRNPGRTARSRTAGGRGKPSGRCRRRQQRRQAACVPLDQGPGPQARLLLGDPPVKDALGPVHAAAVELVRHHAGDLGRGLGEGAAGRPGASMGFGGPVGDGGGMASLVMPRCHHASAPRPPLRAAGPHLELVTTSRAGAAVDDTHADVARWRLRRLQPQQVDSGLPQLVVRIHNGAAALAAVAAGDLGAPHLAVGLQVCELHVDARLARPRLAPRVGADEQLRADRLGDEPPLGLARVWALVEQLPAGRLDDDGLDLLAVQAEPVELLKVAREQRLRQRRGELRAVDVAPGRQRQAQRGALLGRRAAGRGGAGRSVPAASNAAWGGAEA
jgi:hypothetical protein